MRYKAFISTIMRWQVVAPMVAGVAVIVAILRLAGQNQVLSSRALIILCVVVGIVALLVSIGEGHRLYKRTMAQMALTDLLNEGQQFIRDQSQPVSEQLDRTLKDWIDRVEVCLSSYLGQSYVLRFRIQGSRVIMNNMSLLQWWEIVGRVEKLEEFLRE